MNLNNLLNAMYGLIICTLLLGNRKQRKSLRNRMAQLGKALFSKPNLNLKITILSLIRRTSAPITQPLLAAALCLCLGRVLNDCPEC